MPSFHPFAGHSKVSIRPGTAAGTPVSDLHHIHRRICLWGTTANTGQSTWEQIHGGVRETERLIGQKNYNLAMVKARQTLEYMVKCLCEGMAFWKPVFWR